MGKDKHGRTSQGMTFVKEEYEPGIAGDWEDGRPEFNEFTLMELMALEEYAKDLDMTRAVAAAGYVNPSAAARRLKQKEKIRREIREIHEIWRTNMRMTAEHASARHIKLMDKFERDYDGAEVDSDGVRLKSGLASTLGKMSGDYMKAAGNFAEDNGMEGQVVINIDLGDGEVEVDKGGRRAKVRRSDG